MTDHPTYALSIMQPWAALIITGHKLIENRSWRTNIRGRILLHAGKQIDKNAMQYQSFWDLLESQGIDKDSYEKMMHHHGKLGGFIGTVEIVDCVTQSDSPWFFGPHGFVLADPQPMHFHAYRGRQGFFKPSLYQPGPLI